MKEVVAGSPERARRPEPTSAAPPSDRLREWGAGVASVCLAFAVLGAFFLARYATRHYRYPIGWDASYYVWRVNAVTFDGLARIGTIRAGTPLLLAELMRATGQNALTMVAIVPGVLTALIGLGAAAMVRAAGGMRPVWVPVVAFLTWAAFGNIGLIGGHVDNVLNASFVMGAFAAAVAFAWSKRGVVAVAILFMAAALAEWPFYLFAMGVFLLGLGLFSVPSVLDRGRRMTEPLPVVGPLFGAAAGSAVFTALTFLSIPSIGGIGLHVNQPSMRAVLEQRFRERLHQTSRYWAFPLAAIGALLLWRWPEATARRPAKNLFLSMMAAWVITTAAAGAAQLRGIPVAGGRLLSFLFAVPVLAGVFVWLVGAGARIGPRPVGRAIVATVVVAGAVGGFGAVAWNSLGGQRPYMEARAVREAAEAGTYLDRYAPRQDVVFLVATPKQLNFITLGRWWHVVRAALPADVVPRAHRFIGSPAAYLSAVRSGGAGLSADLRAARSRGLVSIVLNSYNPEGFNQAAFDLAGRVVAPGVITLDGPAPPSVVTIGSTPRARTDPFALIWVGALIVLVLVAAGAGWSLALLPSDVVIRAALAPVLGAATMALVGLVWDLVGLRFGPVGGLGPFVVAAVTGWVGAGLRVWRARPRRPGAV